MKKLSFNNIKEEVKLHPKPLILFLVLALFVPFLIFFQLFAQLFPFEYFALVRSTPTLSAWFFSSYVHVDWNHLLGNIGYWIPGSILLCGTAYFLEKKGKAFPKYYFILVLSALLLVFPFILSAVNMGFTQHEGMLGFSGIVFALWGVWFYTLFSLHSFCKSRRGSVFVRVCSIVFAISFFIYTVMTSSSDVMTINHLGHLVGLVFGFFAAWFFDWLLHRTEQKHNQNP